MSEEPPANSACALTTYWDRVQAFKRTLPYGHWQRPSPQEQEDAAMDCFNELTYLQVLRPSAVGRGCALGLSPIEVGRVLDAIEAACRNLLHAVAEGDEGLEHRDRLGNALIPLLDVLDLASRKEKDPEGIFYHGGVPYPFPALLVGEPAIPSSAFMSSRELAQALGIDDESFVAFDAFLRRLKTKFPDCCTYEDKDGRRKTEPHYLYRPCDVWEPSKKWLEKHTKKRRSK
jgi:hypothetical protein